MGQKNKKELVQSGVLPYRIQNGKIEVLLITTSNRKNWLIPKGGICKGMSPPISAAKEAWEEAGVVGQVNTDVLGSYKYRKQGKRHKVKLYTLLVETVSDNYPEVTQRQRQWLDAREAVCVIKRNSLKRMLKQFLKTQPYCCDFG
ncbi:NUDIX domain-containing protein [Scytonema sp. UIC 10036]|uniref:NUDIX hydrolase n=1 Tax=Scytonema sp. UIC 10036 TaxID=2304196 RepID=UPI0012DAE11D|nr:NUDIX hydrolase [Scytonema sp. UIC 10036]MUG99057.1 NUDIX domain-containing protein [Scytonema sp. UIC 10036]